MTIKRDESMIGVGIVGYGYWGPKVARNFAELDGCTVVGICDFDDERLGRAGRTHPGALMTHDYGKLLDRPELDAIAIATPVSTHFDLAMKALRAGKHVWVEKPLTDARDQAETLIETADRKGVALLVDHTFVYTGAVRKIKELVSGGEIGEIRFYDSVRVNLGLFQHDVDVLWDLAVHDLSIMGFILDNAPVAVSATGMGHVPGQMENVGYLTLFFEDDMIAHIHANWLAPVKIRRTLISGTKRMIVYDDLEPSEKIKIYDKGIILENDKDSFYSTIAGYRTGDVWSPQIDLTEALHREALHFLQCIREGSRPLTDGEAGLYVVRVLEAARRSMDSRGMPVEISNG